MSLALTNHFIPVHKITKDDLIDLRDDVKKERDLFPFMACFGFIQPKKTLGLVLERAVEVVEENDSEEDFYYMDFNTTHTIVVSRMPWFRGGVGTALFWLAIYYIFTPILFCFVTKDTQVCPDIYGSTTAVTDSVIGCLYFATVTLTTVSFHLNH
jgi:hypothetical protein